MLEFIPGLGYLGSKINVRCLINKFKDSILSFLRIRQGNILKGNRVGDCPKYPHKEILYLPTDKD